MTDLDGVLGWYGKLPSLGDFASRRIPSDVLETWDAWLSGGLANAQAADLENWLSRYLSSPSWRFLLMPDAMRPGYATHAGVLMPSVDRVGRYFPFTLLQRLDQLPGSTVEWRAFFDWLGRLDDLAVDALQDDWPVDRLEAALQSPAHRRPDGLAGGVPVPRLSGTGQELILAADLAAWMAGQTAHLAQTAWRGQSWWWSDGPDAGIRLRIHQGLPQGVDFESLLVVPPPP